LVAPQLPATIPVFAALSMRIPRHKLVQFVWPISPKDLKIKDIKASQRREHSTAPLTLRTLCGSASVEQARLRPSGRSVHGICDGVPDFIAFAIALTFERASFFSSQFARSSSMTSP